ncbi:MAG: class B sortase [Oscillospiraceae bacterium]|nr:class B sortase [Oscillospiraceae bacterium]
MKKKKSKLHIIIPAILIIIAGFCGFKLWQEYEVYREVKILEEEMKEFEPDDEPWPGLGCDNPDVFAWIKIDDTQINYPVALGEDNRFYLSHNVKKEKATAGAIFMDYRCKRDLSSFNSIIYGHRMKNGSMFQNISKYRTEQFFDSHRTGTLTTKDAKYDLDIFAYLAVSAYSDAYKAVFNEPEDRQAHLDYIKKNAKIYRNADVGINDSIVTLSTCTYEFENARSVVVAKLVPKS